MQEFNSIAAAQALMDTEARDSLSLNGQLLTLDYSISQHTSRGTDASNLADWICTMCQAVNFSRSVQAGFSQRSEGFTLFCSIMHLHVLHCLDKETSCAGGWSAISAAQSVRLTRSE